MRVGEGEGEKGKEQQRGRERGEREKKKERECILGDNRFFLIMAYSACSINIQHVYNKESNLKCAEMRRQCKYT